MGQHPNTMATPQATMATGVASHGGVGLLVGVTPQKPAALARLHDLEDEGMPKTPELTMTYKRLVTDLSIYLFIHLFIFVGLQNFKALN